MNRRRPQARWLAWLVAILLPAVASTGQDAAPSDPAGGERTGPVSPELPRLAAASTAERSTLKGLLNADVWPRRAVGLLRLDRYADEEALAILDRALRDSSWQVRAFAVRSLGRRGIALDESKLADEQEPRVLRAALRYRFPVDPERLQRAVPILLRSDGPDHQMLGVELAAASGDEELIKVATGTARKLILRMTRAQAGVLSPRLAVVCDAPDLGRPYLWQRWLRKQGRRFHLVPSYAVPESSDARQSLEPSTLSQLGEERFVALEDYLESLGDRKLDLAICLDCTASMWGELTVAQGGIDDMMMFLRDMMGSFRVGLVAYRDRRDEFETRAGDFTSDIDTARRWLWQLEAAGGGDKPEAVLPALKIAYLQFSWDPQHEKVLVLIGDAPPRVGTGMQCVDLSRRAFAQARLVTHVIQTENKDVLHFPEIAKAGGGRCVSLEDDANLITEIAGLAIGGAFEDEFREFFEIYLELCR